MGSNPTATDRVDRGIGGVDAHLERQRTEESADEADSTAESTGIGVLLIEDNPGDARLIREMLDRTEELSQRLHPFRPTPGVPRVHVESRLEEGLDRLGSDPPDVVLLDLNLPDSTGLATLETFEERNDSVPVVVLTGVHDGGMGTRAIQRGAQDFLVKDDVTSPLLIRTIHHAIERARQREAQRERQAQLDALNVLNEISHDITHLVITTDDRSQLEAAICDRLTWGDAYYFTWIGGVSRGSDRVVPRASAGVEEGYLDEVEISAEDDTHGQGPTGQAIRTGRVQIVDDIATDPDFEPWRDDAVGRGYRSSAVIPIGYEGILYGVLNVYANAPAAFTGPETAVLARIGDVIGHSFAAIDRREALVSDTVVELEFEIETADPLRTLTREESCRIHFDRLIREGDQLLAYGTVEGTTPETFREHVSTTCGVGELRVLSTGGTSFDFELVAPVAVSLYETVATHGGRVGSAEIADGEFRFVVELPQGRDTRRAIDLVREYHPDITFIAQRTIEREGDRPPASTAPTWSVLEDELTAKQRTALETAYAAGYFDWPRGSTGEEIAERLDISPATLNQHLRSAERKFFESVFE